MSAITASTTTTKETIVGTNGSATPSGSTLTAATTVTAESITSCSSTKSILTSAPESPTPSVSPLNTSTTTESTTSVSVENRTSDTVSSSTGTTESTTQGKSTVVPVRASTEPAIYTDCSEYKESGHTKDGVYKINIKGSLHDVWCDMTTDGGGWTIFQRRFDGSVNFERRWKDYANGFGNVSGEHWLGNIMLHSMTAKNNYKLRIDLEDFASVRKYAEYSSFYISDEITEFRLSLGSYKGDANDSFSYHAGRTFKTMDTDVTGCVSHFRVGWWYGGCHQANLNGVYNSTENAVGLTWVFWHGNGYSLKRTEMKIKRLP